MVTAAFVNIWGKRVGAIIWEESKRMASFQYEKAFLSNGWDLAPLKMPLSDGNIVHRFSNLSNNETFNGLPGLLADTLPDQYGHQLINAWLLKNGRTENYMNPVEQLCFIGERGMGALSFEPSKMPKTDQNFELEVNSLVEIAAKVLNTRKNFSTNLKENEQQAMQDLLKVGTSAGGARPKAIISYNKNTAEVQSGQAKAAKGFEQWILKLDGVSNDQFVNSKGFGRIEMAYYNMASDCGINMMESRLLEENDRAHFMTKRFDRTADNHKIHMQTFCAMRHFDFNNVNSFSYEQLFETMRLLHLPYLQAEQLFRRMVFNVIARNCDDHTKNFAFCLAQDGEWELSPAYDICHAYRPDSIWVNQHALSINGKRQDHTREDLLTVAQSMNIKKANQLIDHILEIMKKWKEYASECGVSKQQITAIERTFVTL